LNMGFCTQKPEGVLGINGARGRTRKSLDEQEVGGFGV